MNSEQYQIGQVFEATMPNEIFADGGARWHALIVAPMREQHAEGWLKARGVYSFHPVRVRHKKIRGATRRIVSRYLPGYVFARFPGRIITHRVVGTPFITDMIRMANGEPGKLDPEALRALHAMREVDEQTQEAEARKRRKLKEQSRLRRGDRAVLLTGVMAGQSVEVLELKAGRAKFSIRMFGGDIPAEADIGELQKVAG